MPLRVSHQVNHPLEAWGTVGVSLGWLINNPRGWRWIGVSLGLSVTSPVVRDFQIDMWFESCLVYPYFSTGNFDGQ